jgi:CMP-N-acetylneuraminic acid synthetase
MNSGSEMRTIALIPARGGSKGLPRKNIRTIGGKPLIAWSIESARASGVCDRIFVSTDDEEIAIAARAAGAEVPFLRPPDLAQDATTMEATLQQALVAFEQWSGDTFDIAVFVTPTDVFRKAEWITRAVNALKERPELESAFAGQATFKNYWEISPEGGYQRVRPYMKEYGQRQERIRNGRLLYREDTGVACASRTWLWREGRRIGDKVEIILTDDPATDIDIHEEFDLYLAEQILKWRSQRGAS